MEIKEIESIPALKRFWIIIKNGMLLYGIRNRLAIIGIDIRPFYWDQDEYQKCKEPIIKGNSNEYHFRPLTSEEISLIAKNFPQIVIGFNSDQTGLGIIHENNIAAFMFIELNEVTFNKRTVKLKDNEAYLLNMWVFNAYRGKNLAPYLRYQSYQILKEQGRNVKYSITDYFNKSSIKFKKKLNSKHLKLYLSMVLFKKYYWNFTLKEYN